MDTATVSGPWEDYKKQPEQGPWNDYGPPQEESDILGDVAKTAGRFGVNVVRGAAQLPGVPLELMVAGGNLLRRQMGLPETRLEDTVARDWGAKGWRDALERNFGKANLPEASNEFERSVDKAGQFVGGGLPFGPAGLLPSATAYVGSEVGRKADENVPELTGGYGEFGGALLGGAGPGLTRGVTTSGIPRAPTNAALKAAKDAAYKAADNEGVIFTPAGMQRLNADVKALAAGRGYDPALEPGIAAVLKRLEDAQQSNVTFSGLDTIRKIAGNAGGDFTKPSQQALSRAIKDQIDDFTDSVQSHEVLVGDAAKAAKLIKEARGLNQRLRLSEQVEEAIYQAENRTQTSGVGGNADNALRQKINSILSNKKRRAGFSKHEIKLMEGVVRGTKGQNALRFIGGFAPQKGFLPALLATLVGGGAVTGTAGVTVPVALGLGAAAGAKQIADALTRRNAQRLLANVRMGAPQKLTASQRANEAWLEMQRRAALARQSTQPAVPGAVYQEQ